MGSVVTRVAMGVFAGLMLAVVATTVVTLAVEAIADPLMTRSDRKVMGATAAIIAVVGIAYLIAVLTLP